MKAIKNTTSQAFVFVYHKDGEIKVLDSQQANEQHELLIFNGWKHTATLDACKFIEYHAKRNKELFKALIS
jgi:hypothetical protein